MSTNPVLAAIPLWHAQMAWAKELIKRSFNLEHPEDILLHKNRGRHAIPGTSWFLCTHGLGVDIYKTPDVGGIDFDFDKPNPDPWRMQIFIERQVNEGNLPYEPFQQLLADDEKLKIAIEEALEDRTSDLE